ncbi:MAG: hypothetical protein K9M80_05990 [Candidatus Marinimicrobia bacterium]|nr:hypothetical protein [Candidatus Neomarinimicrobiota bacterium]
MWQLWVNFVLGIWVLLSGLIASLQGNVNLIICGVIAAVLGFWSNKLWQGIVIGIAGIWLILSGIISGLQAPVNYIIVGIIVAVLAIWGALGGREEPTV